MEIREVLVTYDQALWLCSRGYPQTPSQLSEPYYNYKGELNGDVIDYIKAYVKKDEVKQTMYASIKAPAQWKVLEWLRCVHSIWIIALPTVTGHYAYKILDVQLDPERPIERPPYKNVSAEDYNTPYDAISGAFDYIKQTNLI
jgi:hypothetical protein